MVMSHFRELKISSLKKAPYNPPERVSKRNIRELLKSIGDVGLLYPILVSNDYTIIDGHRRVAVYKALGFETIPAILGKGDPRSLYATVNATPRKMGGHEALVVYLKEPLAVGPSHRVRFDTMVRILGDRRVQRLAKLGYSMKLFMRAIQVANYCSLDESQVPRVFDWLLHTQTIHEVISAMSSQQSPITIVKAIQQKKVLHLKAVLS